MLASKITGSDLMNFILPSVQEEIFFFQSLKSKLTGKKTIYRTLKRKLFADNCTALIQLILSEAHFEVNDFLFQLPLRSWKAQTWALRL